MKQRVALIIVLLGVALSFLRAQQPEPATNLQVAEKYYAEKSFSRAREIYGKIDTSKLSPDQARWVQFRLADTEWRAEAATQTADTTKFDDAFQKLNAMVRDIQREEDKDRIYAEVEESLGDFYWMRSDSKNWNSALPYYQQALDWWAGSDQIEEARKRYIGIVWKIDRPTWAEPYYYYGYYGNMVPLDVLENALKIAVTENDRAHANYLIAMTLRYQGGNYDQRKRAERAFEAAIQGSKQTDWYDDALFYYAEWLSQYGRMVRTEDGGWRQELDFVRALELYRELLAHHAKGESKYYDQAKQRIEDITKPYANVIVSNVFLPDAEVQYTLNWRNTKRIDLTLYRVQLNEAVVFASKDESANNWIQQIPLNSGKVQQSWSIETQDKGDYTPGSKSLTLDQKLPVGAYVIAAIAGANQSRDLILITDATLVLKTSGRKSLIYYADANTGAPIAGASVKLWEKFYDGSNYVWDKKFGTTNQDGIVALNLHGTQSNTEILATANINDRQAFSIGNSYIYNPPSESWRIYAVTDRPAYRPGEQVQWKITARTRSDSGYSTPANKSVKFVINDPQGSKVSEGTLKLNSFGTAWSSVDLTEKMPLGEYSVVFSDEADHGIGSAVLFRLEEYKLPEFKVAIETPKENGKKKAFRIGDTVDVDITAEYYFGGPVSNASVEAIVYQKPFYHYWFPHYDYPWYYEDQTRPNYYYGNGSVIKRETLKTDAMGKAHLSFESQESGGQDLEYTIEARVVDSSRREIIGSDTVRVTKQSYYVYPRPAHYLYRPQDKVQVNLKALDANEQPVSAEGVVKITRDYWYEIWLDPDNKEVKGNELQQLRDRIGVFPPPQEPGKRSWRLKFTGYQHEDIATRPVKLDAEGEGEVTFTPQQDGYYRFAWNSKENDGAPITAETSVWVATNASTELGYRHGGLEIIVDKDTFRAGQKAPVMISVPTNDRYVLFTIEGEDLYDYQLVHVTGTVKLLELPIEEKHVPNIFLGGAMVTDLQLFMDTKEVIVPPVPNFLNVELTSDRAEYQPREDGTFTVHTKDADGKPVSAEVSLSLVDESVFYIQQEYAGDPRQFYFGEKRQQRVQTQSTFQWKSYARKVEPKDESIGVEMEGVEGSVYGGVAGGTVGGVPGDKRNATEAMDAIAEAPKSELKSMGAVAQAPASPPVPSPERAMRNKEQQEALPEEPAVTVRSDFRSTILWKPDLVTDAQGNATVKVKYPDSLTGWKASARAVTTGAQFGIGAASTRTKQPLIVRLQAPRFFVAGDSVTISAVINNNTDQPLTVNPNLEADGFAMPRMIQPHVTVPANGEKRVDWHVIVIKPGTARLKVTARGGTYADAMEKTYPIFEHGIERFLAKSGKVRAEEVIVNLDIPAQRKKESTTLKVQVTPSLAVTMLDALPYLIDYPYGCTEQTMSRFLPAVIVEKTLRDLGVSQESLANRMFGGIEAESADKTHPAGKKDLKKLDNMVKAGLDRLYDFQHTDGGWGWWKDGDSDHYMTAYVLWGLTLAHNAGVESARDDVAARAADFLAAELVEEEDAYDEQAWMLHALAVYRASHRATAGKFENTALENLWNRREQLNAYTRSLLALSAHAYGQTEKAQTLIRNLEDGVKKDTAPDTSIVMRGAQSSDASVMATAHWGEDGIYWRWSDGGIESTAFALRALLAIDPGNALVEPVMNWLIKNRRGAQWSNTRDTAITLLTLTDYLRTSGELKSEMQYELAVNGNSIATKTVTAADVLSAPSVFTIPAAQIRDGNNEIRIRRKTGNGPLYFSAQAEFFSMEEPVPASGNELFVRRQYYKLSGKPTLLKGVVYERRPLNDNETVKSGDRVETVVTIEAKNNYEYLVFEDLKPAGLEAVEIRSGEPLYARELKSGAIANKMKAPANGVAAIEQLDYTERSIWVYQELRDRKVALFIDKLPQGVWEIRYDMRAEVPGQFHALPLMGYAMYVPEIRANDSEIRITVLDEDSK